jgi:deoxyribodipyrimidine photolyase-related protein
MEEATFVKHHPKKIAFIFSAMRHFAAELSAKGLSIRYIQLTDPNNTGSLTCEVERALKTLGIKHLIVTEPCEYRLKHEIALWPSRFDITIDVRIDHRFLCSTEEFRRWAKGKKQLRMEYFYRYMRKKYQILMENDGNPTGGQWNYDQENRKPPSKGLTSPKRISHSKSLILKEVLELITKQFPDHFGTLQPFHYAVTREQAMVELDDFIERILPYFGTYQDAMVKGEPYLNHSLLSTYINAGLLLPLEVCQKAETMYRKNKAPLNAV